MGRATAGLIAVLLFGTAQAEELVPHERVLLRGGVPLRMATDASPICALDLRLDPVQAGDPRLEDWKVELEGALGAAGLRVDVDTSDTLALRASAPAVEFPAVVDAIAVRLRGSALAGSWRAVALVCPGPQKPWIARMDGAFGRSTTLRRASLPDVPAPEPAALTILKGPPALGFLWSAGELSQVEADLALELRRATLSQALEEEEITAQVEVQTDFSRSRRLAGLRVSFEARRSVGPLLDLVRAALAEHEEAPLDRDLLDDRWRAQRVAILRHVDSPLRRVRGLADREDWGSDPSRDLDAARRRSPLAYYERSAALALAFAAVVVQHPRPPTHGELLDPPAARRDLPPEPSFDDEDE